IDLADAEEVFEASVDGTVGIEEEFAILDPQTLDMVPRFEQLRDQAEPELHERITGELIKSEIEIVSGRGEDLADALARQADARRRLFSHAREMGTLLGATGTHPWADYREQQNIETDHYRRVVEGLGYAARRNNTFSLHVHVGIQGADRAVQTCDRLRPLLPLLLALSASSPFVDGHDTLLHSARTETFTRTFPRCGVPDAYGSWQAYRDYIEMLVRTRSIVEYTQVWWSVRPHFTFGTVEMRICDVQATDAESDALAALIAGCTLRAAQDVAEGVPFADPPNRLVEENLWRAIRHGMDGALIDFATGEEVPAREALERTAAWAGIEPAFPERNAAQRQRAMLDEGASLRDVYASIVEETQRTYGRTAPDA
ncbi:MAG: glutamate--cysteine ligase, partial [Solirubrobacterales bacterium]|nr:glutamate--cysteine ligase [Solirubrobacterales bacterium]